MSTELTQNVPLAVTSARAISMNLRWPLVALPLMIITLIGMLDKIAIAIVISDKQFLQDLDLVGRPAVTGLLMSGFLFSYAIFTFVWGYVVHRWGPRISCIAGVLIWGVALALSGLADSAATLIAARIVLGVGEAFMYPVSNAYVANWFPQRERARANSIWMSAIPISGVVSGLFVVTVIGLGGWRAVFYTLATMSIIIPLPMLLFWMTDNPSQQPLVSATEREFIEAGNPASPEPSAAPGAAKENFKFLRDYQFWLLTIAWGLTVFYYWGWSTWMPTYFQTARNFSFKAAGNIFSLTFFFALVVVLIVGYLSDRTMRRAPLAAIGGVVAAVCLFVGGIFVADPYWALVILIISLCAEQGAYLMLMTLLQSIVTKRSVGPAFGVAAGIAQFIGMGSPVLVGFLLQISGFESVISALALSGIGWAVCAFFLIKDERALRAFRSA